MNNQIDDIVNAVSIVDIIQQDVKLSKHNHEYKGLCPFHHEKTPSFFVNPVKNMYYCFGCQASGNVLTFCQQMYNMSFKDALQYLANYAGIKLHFSAKSSQQYDHQQHLITLCTNVNEYFKKQLYHEDAKHALQYLYNRGLTDEMIAKFGIGYAKHNNSHIWQKLLTSNFKENDLREIGLLRANQKGQLYDFFQHRITFPITDIKGKIIAFSSRIVNDNNLPKYMNTKESIIFTKKNVFYNLHNAVLHLKNHQHLLIVEGYLDVIALVGHGFNTAIASMGTAITVKHLELLRRYDQDPIFCSDADNAGYQAMFRVIDLYLMHFQQGDNPRFLFLPQGHKYKDPDSFLQVKTKEGFQKLLDNVLTLSESLLMLVSSKYVNLELPEIRHKALDFINQKLKLLPNNNLYNNFYNYFKYKLLYYKPSKNTKYVNELVVNQDVYQDKIIFYELIILCCILKFPPILAIVDEYLLNKKFINPITEVVKNILLDYIDDIHMLDNILHKTTKKYYLVESNISLSDYIGEFNQLIDKMEIYFAIDVIDDQDEALKEFMFNYNKLFDWDNLNDQEKANLKLLLSRMNYENIHLANDN